MGKPILCPRCGRRNVSGAQMCKGCRKPLALAPTVLRETTGSAGPVAPPVPPEHDNEWDFDPASRRQAPESPPTVTARSPMLRIDPDQQPPRASATTVDTDVKAEGHDEKQPSPPIGRALHDVLCKGSPGRPYLAALGSGEPPEGYPLRACLVTLGRGTQNHIAIEDDGVSQAHALFAMVGRGFVVIDLDSEGGTFVNGRKVAQTTLRRGDVIDVGRTALVFAAIPGPDLAWGYEVRSLLAGDSGDDKQEETPAAGIVLRDTASGQQVTSDGLPILVGRHEDCHMRFEGEDVAMFHAQVYWGGEGVHLRDLGSGSETRVNGDPIDDVEVQPGDDIAIGGVKAEIEFHGDVAAQCRQLARADERQRLLALTCVSGAAQGASATLRPAKLPLIMGRHSECDLRIDEPRASNRHVSLIVGESAFEVGDLGSMNGIRVNGEQVSSATLKVGDILRVGKSDFVVHYAI